MLKLIFTLLVSFTVIVNEAKAQKDTSQATSNTEQASVLGSQWNYDSSTDEMSGKINKIAIVQSTNTVELKFPYEGAQHGFIALRKSGKSELVTFSIEKGQLLCTGSYNTCLLLVRFDEDEPINFAAIGYPNISTTMLNIRDYKRFMSRLRAAKIVRISPRLYQEGSVVFKFSVEGFLPERLEGR